MTDLDTRHIAQQRATDTQSPSSETEPLVLDIGCGDEKQPPEAVGIDVVETSATDLVIDVDHEGLPYGEQEADEVHARMSAEHMHAPGVLAECHRVLKPDGTLHLTVPHPWTSGFWQDWTHRIQPGFTVDGIDYLDSDHRLHYEHDIPPWDVDDVEVRWWVQAQSLPARAFGAGCQAVVNRLSTRAREELLKLPFTGGYLSAELQKPQDTE